MYFWNTKALADEIKAKKLSQREIFKYYFAISVIVVASSIVSMARKKYSIPIVSFELLMSVVSFLGMIYVYKLYADRKKSGFLDAYLPIAFVVHIKTSVIGTLILLPIAAICIGLGIKNLADNYLYLSFAGLLSCAIMIYLEIKWIKYIVASDDKTELSKS